MCLAAAIDAARRQAERAQALADAWGAGGAGNLALTALSAAAGGNVTGSLGSLAQSAAVNVLQGLATRQVKEIADSFTTQKDAQNNPIPTATSETVRSALQGIVACAGSTAGGAGQCSGAAMGAAASVVLNRLGPTPGTDPAGQPLPLEAQQARAALVGTIVTAIAQATGQDASAALAAARIETTNNALAKSSYGSVCVAGTTDGCSGITVEAMLRGDRKTWAPVLVNIAAALGTDDSQAIAAVYAALSTAAATGQTMDGEAIGQAAASYRANQARSLAEANPEQAARAGAALSTLRSLGYTDAQIAGMASAPGAATAAGYTTELNAIRTLTAKLPGGNDKAATAGLIVGVAAASLYAVTNPVDPAKMTAPGGAATGPQIETLPASQPKPAIEVLPPARDQTPVLATPIPKPVDVNPPTMVTPNTGPVVTPPLITPVPAPQGGAVLANDDAGGYLQDFQPSPTPVQLVQQQAGQQPATATINFDHIINGEVTTGASGIPNASGGHYLRSPDVKVVALTGAPDANGIQKGFIEVRNPSTGAWERKRAETTFFPEAWSKRQTVNEITAAFQNSKPIGDGRWQGTAPSGITIQGYYTMPNGGAATAWPVYTPRSGG